MGTDQMEEVTTALGAWRQNPGEPETTWLSLGVHLCGTLSFCQIRR